MDRETTHGAGGDDALDEHLVGEHPQLEEVEFAHLAAGRRLEGGRDGRRVAAVVDLGEGNRRVAEVVHEGEDGHARSRR